MYSWTKRNVLLFGVSIVMLCMLGLSEKLWAQLDDPTRPPGMKKVYASSVTRSQKRRWVLSSILISSVRRVAVINGRSVSRGDQVAGAKVMEILPSEVRLRSKGKVFGVRLLSGQVKKVTRVSRQ